MLPSTAVEQVFLCLSGFGPWLVNMLKSLEGKDGRANVSRLAVPDKLNLALIFKQQESVLVRQLACPALDKKRVEVTAVRLR